MKGFIFSDRDGRISKGLMSILRDVGWWGVVSWAKGRLLVTSNVFAFSQWLPLKHGLFTSFLSLNLDEEL